MWWTQIHLVNIVRNKGVMVALEILVCVIVINLFYIHPVDEMPVIHSASYTQHSHLVVANPPSSMVLDVLKLQKLVLRIKL